MHFLFLYIFALVIKYQTICSVRRIHYVYILLYRNIARAYENTVVPMVCIGLYHHISNNLDILENVGKVPFFRRN